MSINDYLSTGAKYAVIMGALALGASYVVNAEEGKPEGKKPAASLEQAIERRYIRTPEDCVGTLVKKIRNGNVKEAGPDMQQIFIPLFNPRKSYTEITLIVQQGDKKYAYTIPTSEMSLRDERLQWEKLTEGKRVRMTPFKSASGKIEPNWAISSAVTEE